jgi:hypothetical protein
MKFWKACAIGIPTVLVLFILYGFSELHIMGDGMSKCLEGNGKRAEEQRKVGPFTELSVDGAFNLVIDGSRKTGSVILSAESNLLDHIVVEVENDLLSISTNKSICAKTPVNIKLDGNGLHTISTTGASDINFSAIENQRLRVKLSGAGSVTLAGKTTSLTAEVLGASTLMAKDLPAQSVVVKTEGSSSAHVFAKEELDAYSSGASEILFSGSPGHISKQEFEVGEILPFTSE